MEHGEDFCHDALSVFSLINCKWPDRFEFNVHLSVDQFRREGPIFILPVSTDRPSKDFIKILLV